MKIYSKFNIIIIFNKIQIKKKHEKYIIFFIKYSLFEYIVMFFKLYNILNIFQFFINNIL